MAPPNSHPLPRCQNHRKWPSAGQFWTPMVSVRTREHLSTSRMLLGGSPEAWPMAHGHSQVRHPGQSRLPGPMVVAGTIFQQIAMCIVAPPPFLSIFRLQVTVWPFSAECTPVRTRERPSTCLLYSGGVPGAWRTVHGHSHVRHPACCGLPGQTPCPRRLFVCS